MNDSKGRAFILLHGGGMGAWIWERLVPLLGYPALAVDERSDGDVRRAGLADCAGHVARAIEEASIGHAILVAHSGSGIIAPLVPGRSPAVERIVFLSAAIPADGANIQQGLPLPIKLANSLSIRLNSRPFPAKRMEKLIREKFCNACGEDEVRFFLSHSMKPESPCVLSERVHRGRESRVPGTYVKFLDDRTLSPERMDLMIENYGCEEVLECPGDHMAMLGRPRELASALNGIADRLWTA